MHAEKKHGETDRVYKRFYADPAVVEEIVRDFVGGAWTRELDFATLERLPAEMIDPVLPVVRHADMMWRVRFRDRPLHVVLLFEFQSSPDPNMAVRIAVETGVFYRELAKLRKRDPSVGEHVVVPVVVKSFEGPWTAARSMAEWLGGGVPEELAEYAAGQGYALLDEAAEAKKAGASGGAGGVVRAAMALRRERDPARLSALVRSLDVQLGASSVARDALAEWIRSQMINSGATEAEVAHLDTLREAGEMYVNQFQETFRDGLAQGVEQGLAQGVEQGLAKGLAQGVEQGLAQGVEQGLAQGVEQGVKQAHVDIARWKFGEETAERLAELLEGAGDTERVSRIGRLLVECETGEELIAKAARA